MALRVIFQVKSGKVAGDMVARYMSTAGPKKVGFIGLGNMGGFMVKNLMKKVRFRLSIAPAADYITHPQKVQCHIPILV